MKETAIKLALLIVAVICGLSSCNTNEPEKTNDSEKESKMRSSFSYTTYEVSLNEEYRGELHGEVKKSNIDSIYRQVLSTYLDQGVYLYDLHQRPNGIVLYENKTEKEIKEYALEFGEKADSIIRSKYNVPYDVTNYYCDLDYIVSYTYGYNKPVEVKTYSYR